MFTTESLHYPKEGGGSLTLSEDESLTLPRPDFGACIAAARARGLFPIKYFRSPEGEELLGLGTAVSAAPRTGLASLHDTLQLGYREAKEHFLIADHLPAAFLSVWFDPLAKRDKAWKPYPHMVFHVPAILCKREGDDIRVYFTASRMDLQKLRDQWIKLSQDAQLTPELHSPELHPEWNDGYTDCVKDAVSAIKDGELEKVVLARSASVELPGPVYFPALLRSADEHEGDCYVAIDIPAAGHAFISLTPERLASVRGGKLRTGALAGTYLGEEEQIDGKMKAEHKYVTDSIRNALKDLGTRVDVSDKAVPRRYGDITHLFTEITASLHQDTGLLEGIAALHPTPAVCGTPYNDALDYIRLNEELVRGMYAGVFGYVDSENEGEAAVAIRSLRIDGNRAEVYAGAGIVAESDPQAEDEETRAKVESVLNILRSAI